jgi:DNA-binding transcriptional ArsR family regulator
MMGGKSTSAGPRVEAGVDEKSGVMYFTNRLNTMTSHHLDATFAALADPTRRGILSMLASGEKTVTQLAEPFRMTLPAVSKHLKVLQKAGLVRQSREAQWRPCRLEAAPLKEATEWMEKYRIYWEQSFDKLDEHLRRTQKKETKRDRK